MAEIKVYSTPTCPWCIKTKEFLDQHKVQYENIDVSKDQAKAQEMMEKSGQMGVPVVDAKGTIIVGYNEEAMKKALGL